LVISPFNASFSSNLYVPLFPSGGAACSVPSFSSQSECGSFGNAICSVDNIFSIPSNNSVVISLSLIRIREGGETSLVPSATIGIFSPSAPQNESPLPFAIVPMTSVFKSGTSGSLDAISDGFEVTQPSSLFFAECMPLMLSSVAIISFDSENTSKRSDPFVMHIMRNKSSSPNQIIRAPFSDCQHPLSQV